MADRPAHISRAFAALRVVTAGSPLATGDLQQLSGYMARLERRVMHLESLRPSVWRRIRRSLTAFSFNPFRP